MSSRSYEDAIDALNSLQTNFKVLQARREAGITVGEHDNEEMRAWLKRIGYSNRDLDRLNIVHVAGTKGKGTTCAYVDSILSFHRKQHGLPRKTGLFTSPHLVSVRERIRIDSSPISPTLFATYFFDIWDRLEATAKELSLSPEESHKPAYFRYLTLMSLHAFLSEGVDVAVYEVGVGGEFDSTNIVQRPSVTGISTLGIDHVLVLGDTVAKIAWHKAGILKSGSPGFTVKQVPEAVAVIAERAEEKGVSVVTIGIHPALKDVSIKPDAEFQRWNASLAIKLAETVLQKVDPEIKVEEGKLPQDFVDGLEQVVWRGRCETKVEGPLRWYIDGAHTADSLKVAAQWFGKESSQHSGKRILIFNQQGRVEAPELLTCLFTSLKTQGLVKFDHAIFCTNVTYAATGYKKDFVNHMYDPAAIASLSVQRALAETWSQLDGEAQVVVKASIEEALDYARALSSGDNGDGNEKEVQAFITGSLHLVGGALGVLEGASTL